METCFRRGRCWCFDNESVYTDGDVDGDGDGDVLGRQLVA